MVAAMSAGSPVVVHLIAGEVRAPFHLLIGHPPVAAVDIQVGAAILEENADRLRFGLTDQGGIHVATAETDVGSDSTEDTVE